MLDQTKQKPICFDKGINSSATLKWPVVEICIKYLGGKLEHPGEITHIKSIDLGSKGLRN